MVIQELNIQLITHSTLYKGGYITAGLHTPIKTESN